MVPLLSDVSDTASQKLLSFACTLGNIADDINDIIENYLMYVTTFYGVSFVLTYPTMTYVAPSTIIV